MVGPGCRPAARSSGGPAAPLPLGSQRRFRARPVPGVALPARQSRVCPRPRGLPLLESRARAGRRRSRCPRRLGGAGTSRPAARAAAGVGGRLRAAVWVRSKGRRGAEMPREVLCRLSPRCLGKGSGSRFGFGLCLAAEVGKRRPASPRGGGLGANRQREKLFPPGGAFSAFLNVNGGVSGQNRLPEMSNRGEAPTALLRISFVFWRCFLAGVSLAAAASVGRGGEH